MCQVKHDSVKPNAVVVTDPPVTAMGGACVISASVMPFKMVITLRRTIAKVIMETNF